MVLNRKNLPKMNTAQKAAYKRKLAYVRSYVRDRTEFKRLQKAGDSIYATLQQFRDNKHGKLNARITEKKVRSISMPDVADLEGKLERLLNTLKEAKKLTRELGLVSA